jgi:hypothetical protein
MERHTRHTYRWKLLGTQNAKTIKGQKKGYATYITYLAPHTQNSKGINLCPKASDGCAKACLFTAGRGKFNNVEQARIRKTEFYLNDRIGFIDMLTKEIGKVIAKETKAGQYTPVFRLNGTSDIRWEKQKGSNGKSIIDTYPDVQFYDYTKLDNRFDGSMPDNYHLTFSRSEDNDEACQRLLAEGYNVTYVFDEVPAEWNGYKVISGDETDLRFLDEQGVIVGLKYKKANKTDLKEAIESGFVVDTKKELV